MPHGGKQLLDCPPIKSLPHMYAQGGLYANLKIELLAVVVVYIASISIEEKEFNSEFVAAQSSLYRVYSLLKFVYLYPICWTDFTTSHTRNGGCIYNTIKQCKVIHESAGTTPGVIVPTQD